MDAGAASTLFLEEKIHIRFLNYEIDLIQMSGLYEHYQTHCCGKKCYDTSSKILLEDLQNKNWTMLVAMLENQPIGFLQMSLGLRRDGLNVWYLENLYVLPNYRCQGITRNLLSEAHLYMRTNGGGTIFIEIAPINHLAKKIFLSNGFHQISLLHYVKSI